MAGMEDGGVKEDGPGARHRYRICELTEASGKGRPKRHEIMAWNDLTPADVAHLRELNEPRLKPRQVAELDGRTVARGSDVSAGEAEASEPVPHPASIHNNSPMEIADFASRLSWDAYQRAADASAELRAQIVELNQHTLNQTKQIVDLLDQIRTQAERPVPPPPPPPRQISTEDIAKLVHVGVAAIKEIKKAGGN
ncbi:hypothetical protein OV203_47145 [Nannocystis sp. ILAH1]|uniref:hypothetical protein n=1 Tax=Nannocystis sp. ILAH1 TaxID=2996789 RepID=UPI00226FC26A|nr:hypothetical protein [Nannocystis sp. ILAH1]MCY0994794.1 hypothetical protein [Nannocystis sp. ILAH1]